jgi:hypothetical protein
MADGTRLRYDGVETYLATQLDAGVTTIEFTTPLTTDGNFPIDTLTGDEYLSLSILDANYRLQEIVHLVAYDSNAVTGTIERAQEGTTDLTHPVDNKVVHATTVLDFTLVQDHDDDANAHPEILAAAIGYTDQEIAEHEQEVNDRHPYYVKKTGDTLDGDFTVDGESNTMTVVGNLVVGSAGTLTIDGDLVINGRLFLNGFEVSAGNTRPTDPGANHIHFQTFG